MPTALDTMPSNCVHPMADRERELARSSPDFVCYAPQSTTGADATNQHFVVTPTREGAFLGVWTQASAENEPDQRVVFSRSEDHGKTWTAPQLLEGPHDGDGKIASWAFTYVVPHTGRVYAFYNKHVGIDDVRRDTTGELRCRWSDDDGRSWSREHGRLAIRKSAISHPDAGVPGSWVAYQPPTTTQQGEVIVGFTRWASSAVAHGGEGLFDRMSEAWFLRFGNILTEDDPFRLRVTTLPEGNFGLRVPDPRGHAVSIAQEPSVQSLSDGRLVCVMRTATGMVWFALSGNDGRTWSAPQPLRYAPDGPPVAHPLAPCPLYRLGDGRYLLFHHNNDGTINGAAGPADSKRNRNPTYLSVGRELTGHPEHPLRFGPARLFADSGFVAYGARPNIMVGGYGSLFELEGKVYYWYPDRKHFLLGRILGDDLLSDDGLAR